MRNLLKAIFDISPHQFINSETLPLFYNFFDCILRNQIKNDSVANKQYYNKMNPLVQLNDFSYCNSTASEFGIICVIVLAVAVYILSKITNFYSWMDRLWSILPLIFALHFLFHQNHCNDKPISSCQLLILALISLWSVRLTYNFWRKGGYTRAGEDYRMTHLHRTTHPILWEILNLGFVSFAQPLLLLYTTLPLSYVGHEGINNADAVCLVLWGVLFVGQCVADHQQWVFQSKKHDLLKTKKLQELPQEYKCGFIKSGLFKYSRHPNFFCEIAMWWVIYFFSLSHSGINWSGVGAVCLNLLFLGSTRLTEKLSSSKYPAYKQYQKEVSMLIPTLTFKSNYSKSD